MSKFEIVKITVVVPDYKEYYEGCTLDYIGHKEEVIESFNTEKEANTAIDKYKSTTRVLNCEQVEIVEYAKKWIDDGELNYYFVDFDSLNDVRVHAVIGYMDENFAIELEHKIGNYRPWGSVEPIEFVKAYYETYVVTERDIGFLDILKYDFSDVYDAF